MWECGSVVILNYYHCLITKDAINFYKDILGGIFTSSVILVLATTPPSLERELFFTGASIKFDKSSDRGRHLSGDTWALQLCSSVAQVGPGPVAGWRHGWPLGAGLLLSRPRCSGAQACVATSRSYHHLTAYSLSSELCSSVVCSLVSSQAQCSLVLYRVLQSSTAGVQAGWMLSAAAAPARWPARQRGAAGRHLCRRAADCSIQ